MTEHEEQAAVFDWRTVMQERYPVLRRLMFHVPNGGYRAPKTARQMKQAGVVAGVPDILLWAPRLGYHGLAIEMKTERGAVSPEQVAWHGDALEEGYYVTVCRSAGAAIKVICWYLGIEEDV